MKEASPLHSYIALRRAGKICSEASSSECVVDSHAHVSPLYPLKALALLALTLHAATEWQGIMCPTRHRRSHPDCLRIGRSTRGSLECPLRRRKRFGTLIVSRVDQRSVRMLTEPLDEFESRAFAGVWSGELDLDDGLKDLRVYLDGMGTCTSAERFSNCKWEARVERSSNATSRVFFKMWLGSLLLEGTGVRNTGSLRCTLIEGSVLEGVDDTIYVGRFHMSFSLPAASHEELQQLQQQHEAKMNNRRAPLARFRFDAFCGQWTLMLALSTPLLLTVVLGNDGSFSSLGSDSRLAGTWGVFDSTMGGQQKRRPEPDEVQPGTDVWLLVNHNQCDGFPEIKESFWLEGKPDLSSLMVELSARSEDGSSYANKVQGYCYFGSTADREWSLEGRFAMDRERRSE